MIRQRFSLAILLISLFGISTSQSQIIYPQKHVTLYGSGKVMNTKVERPARYTNPNRAAGLPSTFQVNYTGFSAAQEAAFQQAVDLWASEFYEQVPITIDANFTSISGGGLASGGPNAFVSGSSPISGALYPIALYNQSAGCDQDPLTADMTININSDSTWYTGIDANPGASEYDLVTVALHQIAHGLGVVGSADVDDGSGQCAGVGGTSGDGCLSTTKYIYDHFIVNGAAAAITSFTNPSGGLKTQLESGNLFFSGPNAVAANGASNPQIEANATFTQATDFSFLDETIFPAGNAHSLVTPVIGKAEAIHDPGGIIRGMLKDFGWTMADLAVANIDVREVYYTGMSLQFGDASSLAVSWDWDFDTSVPSTDAVTQNPTHTYTTAGTYNVSLSINGGTSTISKTVQIFDLPGIPYTEDFESGIAGFYEVSAGCNDKWELGASPAFGKSNFQGTSAYIGAVGGGVGGFNSWVTNLSGDHGTSTEYYLESPPFSFIGATGDYFIEFNYRCVTISSGFNLQYSTDGGNTWAVLGTVGDPLGVNWYTTSAMSMLGGEDGWTGAVMTVFHPMRRINLVKGFADVRFRFKFGADSGLAFDGVQIDDFQISGNVLPVEDLTFMGTPNETYINLDWTTSSELNNDYFQVEKSLNGQDFESIGKVDGHGTIDESINYEFIDQNPKQGLNYYRLKQVNTYGSYVYSSPIQVKFDASPSVNLFPNPANDQIDLQIFLDGEHNLEFNITSLSGKSVMSISDSFQGEFFQKMDVSHLSAGIYLYETKLNEKVVRGKLVIRR